MLPTAPPTGLPGESDLQRAAGRGDPLADAVAAAAVADPGVHRQVAVALREGAAAPAVTSPPVRALAAHLEETARAAGDDVALHDARASHTAPFAAHVFDVGAGALLNSYRPPGPAAVLVGTGALLGDTDRRLLDTALWLNAASVPGWLRPGEPGYVATGHVRLAHAAVRLRASRPGRTEVSQLDLVRTWLDFALVAPRCAARLGFPLTEEEHVRLLRHWRRLGALLGVEPALVAGAVRRRDAEELEARVLALTPPPSPDSRRLTATGLDAIATGLVDLTHLPRPLARFAVHAVTRALHGPEVSDALGVPRTGGAELFVPPVAAVLRARRRRLRRDPDAWEALVDRNVELSREFVRSGGAVPPVGPAAGLTSSPRSSARSRASAGPRGTARPSAAPPRATPP